MPDTRVPLPEDVASGDSGHATLHNQINHDVNTLYDQVTSIANASARKTLDLPGLTAGLGTFNLASHFSLISVQASGACRLRLYRTSTDRTADLARTAATEPSVRGVMLQELVWNAAGIFWPPTTEKYMADGQVVVYYNLETVAPVTIDISWI